MYVPEWQTFIRGIRERKLLKSCGLGTVQSQLYRLYREETISRAQWQQFEADLHQLEPALPWLG
jgi:hypothetical protein